MSRWSDPEVLDQVIDFYRNLDEKAADAFDAAVERLTEAGPTLGRPTVGEIDLRDYSKEVRDLFGSKLKELRPAATDIRVLFVFGPDRVPVLLYAGDKAGEWTRWYGPAIHEATRAFREYLEDIRPG
jgi:hypothetical protein